MTVASFLSSHCSADQNSYVLTFLLYASRYVPDCLFSHFSYILNQATADGKTKSPAFDCRCVESDSHKSNSLMTIAHKGGLNIHAIPQSGLMACYMLAFHKVI